MCDEIVSTTKKCEPKSGKKKLKFTRDNEPTLFVFIRVAVAERVCCWHTRPRIFYFHFWISMSAAMTKKWAENQHVRLDTATCLYMCMCVSVVLICLWFVANRLASNIHCIYVVFNVLRSLVDRRRRRRPKNELSFSKFSHSEKLFISAIKSLSPTRVQFASASRSADELKKETCKILGIIGFTWCSKCPFPSHQNCAHTTVSAENQLENQLNK